MSAFWVNIRDNWLEYSMSTVSLVLCWIALVWNFLSKGKKNISLILYAVAMPILILTAQTLGYFFLDNRTMDKLFYLLPIEILICYTGTQIAVRQLEIREMKKKWIIIVLYAIIVQSGISLAYSADILQGGMNQYKVSPTVGRLADFIVEDGNLTEPYVLAPDEIATQIQEYNPNIRVVYGIDYEYSADNIEQLLWHMDAYACNCLIIPFEKDNEEVIKAAGYRMIVIYDGYTVYARK